MVHRDHSSLNGCTILSIAAKIPVNEEAFTDVQMYQQTSIIQMLKSMKILRS